MLLIQEIHDKVMIPMISLRNASSYILFFLDGAGSNYMQGTASSKFKIDRKPAGSKVHFHVNIFSLIPYSVLFSLSFSYLFWHPTLTSLKSLFEVFFIKFLLFILTPYINFSQVLIWGFFILIYFDTSY